MNPDQHDHERPPICQAVQQGVAQINRQRQAPVPDLCAQVKSVVVIASSSRGGSSIFSEILRHSPYLLHFKGEINPFLNLAGLSFPQSGRPGDVLEAEDADRHNLAKLTRFKQEMALDVSVSGKVNLDDERMLTRFLNDLHWRLCIQWPEISFERDFLAAGVSGTLAELCREHGWQKGEFNDPQLFHAIFLRNLRTRYKQINPYYYDLRPGLLQRYCPDAVRDYHSPSRCIIEEPPFVPIAPAQYITPEMAQQRPLILKTPGNVYRLPFLKKLFRNAEFKVLHLTRNPADSINGLIDGWLYHGFFSYAYNLARTADMPQSLNIQGYSAKMPDGGNWWKYDLPPDWSKWINRPLEYVCGHQWQAAHQQILDYLGQTGTDHLRVKFEDVIGPPSRRRAVFAKIIHWLGIDGEAISKAAASDLPPVMATTALPPRQRRWFKKAALIKPVLTDPGMKILSTAKKLGYNLDEEINNYGV